MRRMTELKIIYVDPRGIIAPGAIGEVDKYLAMRRTLQSGGALPPIILDHRRCGAALSGSHRLAAWNDEGCCAAVIYTKPQHEEQMLAVDGCFDEIINSLPSIYRDFDQ